MLYSVLCTTNEVQQEGVAASLGLAFELFCSVPLHKI